MDDLLSLIVHASFTTSSSNTSLFHDQTLLCQERFVKQKKSPQLTKRSFANLEEADGQFYLPIQKSDEKMREFLIEEDENKNKKKKRKMDRDPVVDDETTEHLKRFITGDMFGLDMKFVIQKTLYTTDMDTTQNRLNLPIKQLKTHPDEFLTADEKRIVDESKEGLEVRVMGPKLQMYEKPLRLKTWHMKHSDNYVLKKNWNNFAAANEGLKKDTIIQVWSFRKDRQLCFAIVPVEIPDAANDAS